MVQVPSIRLTHGDYTIGWVCALPKEKAAALFMLDDTHDDLPNPANDHNAYELGSIGKHNIVIACLPMGRIGNNNSATVATRMITTFPNIKVGLMVGIGGGVPPDVRLGDVVVSCPKNGDPGVIQWDMGKAEKGGQFKQTGSLNNPPTALLTALSKFEANPAASRAKILNYLDNLKTRNDVPKSFIKSESLVDVLYKSNYNHVDKSHGTGDGGDDDDDDAWEHCLEEETDDCRLCDANMILKRPPREDLKIHYGLIASGNQVIKDAKFRNKLRKNFKGNVLCIEMEAAGLMNDFPCIVIRGVCDYADSHKNKAWQDLIDSARSLLQPLWSDKTKEAAATPAIHQRAQAKGTNENQSAKSTQSETAKPAGDGGDSQAQTRASSEGQNVGNRIDREEDPGTPLPQCKPRGSEGSGGEPTDNDNHRTPAPHASTRGVAGERSDGDDDDGLPQRRLTTSESAGPQQESIVSPEAMPDEPDVAVPANTELQKLDLMKDSVRILREKGQTDAEEQLLSRSVEDASTHLKEIQKEREMVESELAELDIKRKKLIEEENNSAQQILHFNQTQTKIKKKQEHISKEWGYIQKQLHKLQGIDGHDQGCDLAEVRGWTPLRWAAESGHVEIAKYLLDQGDETAAMSEDGQTPLIAASAKGHIDIVRLLLSTSGIDLGLRDGKFGRTALDWATENGHEAIVQLLADSGKAEMTSEVNDGQPSLRSTAEGGYGDVTQRLLELSADLECQHTLRGHTSGVYSAVFSADLKLVASGSLDGSIKIWDAKTGRCQQTLQHSSNFDPVALSPNSKLLALVVAETKLKIWDVVTGQYGQTMQGHRGGISSMAFSPDSKLIASGSTDTSIKIWDVMTGQCQQTLRGHSQNVTSVAFLPDSKLMASGSADTCIKIWDATTGQCQQTLRGHSEDITSLALSPDSSFMASGSADTCIKIWDIKTGRCQQTLPGHSEDITSLAFSPDSKLVVSGSANTSVKIWDANTGQCHQTYEGLNNRIRSVIFLPNWKLVALGTNGKLIRLWGT
ncbi:hypothetical protein J3F84DRAFT_343976 [Trichoderma pleuroticola]